MDAEAWARLKEDPERLAEFNQRRREREGHDFNARSWQRIRADPAKYAKVKQQQRERDRTYRLRVKLDAAAQVYNNLDDDAWHLKPLPADPRTRHFIDVMF